jgi:hypothetical protein
MCFAVQNQQLIAAVQCTPYFLLVYSLYCISNLFFNIQKCSIWFVFYDAMPCWNMIGQNEDRLLYTNTGQAFNIDTISQDGTLAQNISSYIYSVSVKTTEML